MSNLSTWSVSLVCSRSEIENENAFYIKNIQSINSRVKLGETNFNCDPICYRSDNCCIVHVYLNFNARLTDNKSYTAIMYTFTLMPRIVGDDCWSSPFLYCIHKAKNNICMFPGTDPDFPSMERGGGGWKCL